MKSLAASHRALSWLLRDSYDKVPAFKKPTLLAETNSVEPSFLSTPLKIPTTSMLLWLYHPPEMNLASCKNEVLVTATRVFWQVTGGGRGVCISVFCFPCCKNLEQPLKFTFRIKLWCPWALLSMQPKFPCSNGQLCCTRKRLCRCGCAPTTQQRSPSL